MFKKFASVFLVLSILLSFAVLPAAAAQEAEGGRNQEGFIAPIDDPDANAVAIATPEELASMASNLYGSYVLTADIDMSSYGNWSAIGKTLSGAFHGKLDGQGHTVRGLTVAVEFNSGTLLAPYYSVGLFGVCDGAQIKNIILENVDVSINTTSGYRYDNSIIDSEGTVFAGGVVGYACNNTVIFNSSVSGKVSAKASGEGYSPTVAGGLVGYNSGGIVSYCYNSASVDSYNGNVVVAENGFAGGLIARAENAGVVDCSYNTGKVSSRVLDYGVSYAGGLLAEGASASVDVTNCFNSGEVYAISGNMFSDPAYAGGIAADFSGSISKCYNSGLVTAQIADPYGINSVNAFAGGICGNASGGTSVTACASNNSAVYTSTSGTKYENRIANGGVKSNNVSIDTYSSSSNLDADTYVSADTLKAADIYANTLGWDFTSTWQMVAGVDFPQLKQVDTHSDIYQDEFIQQHLAFIQSSTYSDILANHRWAKIYWSQENNFYSNLGGALYKVTDSLVKLSQLKLGEIFDDDDPFVLILGDYVSHHTVKQSVEEIAELKLPHELDEKFAKLSKFIKSNWENAWGELSDEDLFYLYHYNDKPSEQWITENFEDHLEEIVAPEKQNVIADLFNLSSDVVDSFIKAKKKYNSIAKWINGFFTYAANVKAYVDASMEFHTILEKMQENLPTGSVTENYYNIKLKAALNSYTQYNNESFLTAKIFANYVRDCEINTFKTNLKKTLNDSFSEWVKGSISTAAFEKLKAIGWFAEKTWKICEYVTKNGELQECREMLKANAYFEETAYRALRALESQFTMIQSFENACIFDAAFKFLKETELCSMDTVIKYLDTYQCSWLQAIRHRSNTFMNSAIEEVHINKLFLSNTYCHGFSYSVGGKIITVACPTNVFVYDGNDQLIASVENGAVSYCASNSLAYTANAVKLFAVPSGENYRVRIDATDNGSMSYSVFDYDEQRNNTQAMIYTDIPIARGDSFTGEIAADASYSLTDKNNETVEGAAAVTGETNIPVTGVSVSAPKTILQTGEQIQCGAEVQPTDATLREVVWISSNPEVVSVSESGKVTAVGEGSAIISAQSIYGGVMDECELTVISPDHSLVITKQPEDCVYVRGETPEALTLSYYQVNDEPVSIQWYVADGADAVGSAIKNADGTSFLPDTDTIKTRYYYAEITDGKDTVVTRTAKITITAEKIICSGSQNDLVWELTEGMRLSVSGSGELAFDEGNDVPWSDYRDVIREIQISEGITAVGETVLQNHSALEKIVFPTSITALCEGILSGCSSLRELVVPFVGTERTAARTENAVLGILFGRVAEGGVVQYYTLSGSSLSGYRYAIPSTLTKVIVTDASVVSFGAFYNCTSIGELELNEGITQIDSCAFYGCSNLKKMVLPDSLISIGDTILCGCSALQSLTVPFIGKTSTSNNSGESVLGYFFGTDSGGVMQYLSQTNNSIAVNSFSVPEALENITVTSATIVPFGAFSNCVHLKSVHLNCGITIVGSYAFLNCTGLKELTLPDSLTSIAEYALQGCHSLTKLTVPFVGANRSANGTYEGAFGYVFGRIGEADSNFCVQYCVLEGSSLSGYGYAVPDFLEEIVVTDAEQIPVGAFCNMDHLKTLCLNGDITEIGSYAFYGVTHLSDIYYNNWKSEWDNIEKGSANSILNTATIHYLHAKLAGHSVSLDGDIGVSFYMELSPEIASSETAYMLYTIPNGDNPYTVKVYINEQSDATLPHAKKKDNYYVFKCNVAAKEIGSQIKAQMSDGENIVAEYTYSVREYADYLLDNAKEDGTPEQQEYFRAAPLVRAMLQYGAYAKEFFDKTDTLPDPGDVAIGDKFAGYAGNLPDDLFSGTTLSLKSQTTLSLYFSDEDELTFTCTDEKGNEREVEAVRNGSTQIARILNIAAAELQDSFTVTVKRGGIELGTVTYSPMNYCYEALHGGTDDKNLKNVVKALYRYSQAAIDFFCRDGE